MDVECRVCCVCKFARRQLLCRTCANSQALLEATSHQLEQSIARKASLERTLSRLLDAKSRHQEQSNRLHFARQSLQHSRRKIEAALIESTQVRGHIRSLKETRHKHNQPLEEYKLRYAKAKAGLTAGIRQRLLHLRILQDETCTELRKHIRVLLAILPISLTKILGRTNSPVAACRGPAVSICGCQLPDSRGIAFAAANQQTLSTALGYTTLLLSILATLLMAPVVNQLYFCGSTSELWQPTSFWEGQRTRQSKTYRLYLDRQANSSGAVSHSSSSPALHRGIASFGQRWSWDCTLRYTLVDCLVRTLTMPLSAPSAQPYGAASSRKQKENMATATHQLMRTICIVHDDQYWLGHLPLTQGWAPFAMLAGLCRQLNAPRSSHLASSLCHSTWQSSGNGSASEACIWDGDHDDEEFEGWDLVQRPSGLSAATRVGRHDPLRMPPTPSDTDELIKHWERAMITDSSRRLQRHLSLAPTSLGSRIVPIGRGAFAAAERLFQGLARSDVS